MDQDRGGGVVTTIKQTDRDVAAEMFYYMDGTPERSDAIRAGLRDDMDYVQAFARHRIAAEQRGMIAARDAAVKAVNSQSDLVCDDCCRDALDIAADAIATMPKGGEW